MAVELGGRGDYGVVWAWPRAPRGRGVGGEAMDAVGRVRSRGSYLGCVTANRRFDRLPYPVRRLCHTCPALRPACALTSRIPLG